MQCIKNALGSILDLKEITYNPFEIHENPDEFYWGSNRIRLIQKKSAEEDGLVAAGVAANFDPLVDHL